MQGEKVQRLDELGNAIFVEAFEYVDIVGAIVSAGTRRYLGGNYRRFPKPRCRPLFSFGSRHRFVGHGQDNLPYSVQNLI